MFVNPEYILCRQIAYYIRAQYPGTLFRFDYAGLFHTKTQAGMMKALQCVRGYPDLLLLEKRNGFGGLFIELKPEGSKLYKKDGTPVTPHVAEQLECLLKLNIKGYKTAFGIGFEQTRKIIDDYMNNRL